MKAVHVGLECSDDHEVHCDEDGPCVVIQHLHNDEQPVQPVQPTKTDEFDKSNQPSQPTNISQFVNNTEDMPVECA